MPRNVCPADATILFTIVIVAFMMAYMLANHGSIGQDANNSTENGATAPAQGAPGILSGSDNPEDNEAGATEEPELIELRKQDAAQQPPGSRPPAPARK